MKHKKRNYWKDNNTKKKALQNLKGFFNLQICFDQLGYKSLITLWLRLHFIIVAGKTLLGNFVVINF
jgi:hypothetical protein